MKGSPICRFFASPKGCREGANCRFVHNLSTSADPSVNVHIAPSLPAEATLEPSHLPVSDLQIDPDAPICQQVTTSATDQHATTKSKILIQLRWTKEGSDRPPLQRPQPKIALNPLDTRALELQKLTRRFVSSFKPFKGTGSGEDDVFDFEMPPSDPDFPFDLAFLCIRLMLPKDYSSAPASIQITNQEIPLGLRDNIRKAWNVHCKDHPSMSLLERFKWLDRDLETLLVMPPAKEITPVPSPPKPKLSSSIKFVKPTEVVFTSKTVGDEGEEEKETLSDREEQPHQASDKGKESNTSYPAQSPHRGTQVRLSNTQLYHISLLKCSLLNMTFRCFRCKEAVDVSLQPQSLDAKVGQGEQWKNCSTCNSSLGFRYRADIIHMNSSSLGYLDLTPGVTLLDMRPSAFQVTCDNGHETTQGFKSLLRDVEYRSVCHQCHVDLKLQLGPVKFIQLSPAGLSNEASNVMPYKRKSKKKNDELGIVVGTALPNNGTCEHYKKSYR